MVDALRTRGVIPKSLRLDFERPRNEPMLWVPDVVAGAVSASHAGDREHRLALDPSIRAFVIAL